MPRSQIEFSTVHFHCPARGKEVRWDLQHIIQRRFDGQEAARALRRSNCSDQYGCPAVIRDDNPGSFAMELCEWNKQGRPGA